MLNIMNVKYGDFKINHFYYFDNKKSDFHHSLSFLLIRNFINFLV